MKKKTGSKKVYQTTLEGMEDKISRFRRDGNTTRLIDNAIQILYSGKVCVVLDHYDDGKYRNSNKLLFEAILKRLTIEHRLYYLIKDKKIRINKSRLEIEFLKDKHPMGNWTSFNS